jgi:MFS family permease
MLPQKPDPVSAGPPAGSLLRSRSAALIVALFISSLATGVILISIPLKLAELRATPNEIGVTLAMFGLGMFIFEAFWGLVADRFGYPAPLIVSAILYSICIVLLARTQTVPVIAAAYLLAAGMMVAAGPIGRSFVGTSLPAGLRATGLAFLSAAWVIGGAIGAGVGGLLIDRLTIAAVLTGSAVLPLLSAALMVLIFRGYSDSARRTRIREQEGDAATRRSSGVARVLVVTASMIFLIHLGIGGETALLPLLVTSHLHLSAATAGSALFAVGLMEGLLLVPGGRASDRWGRRPTMIAGGILSAAGYVVYSVAGGITPVFIGAALRALGMSLIWPAATAWISEAMPQRRHALMMGLFGEFENAGITAGPVLGGLAWSLAGIQTAFLTYAAAAMIATAIAVVMVHRPTTEADEAINVTKR